MRAFPLEFAKTAIRLMRGHPNVRSFQHGPTRLGSRIRTRSGVGRSLNSPPLSKELKTPVLVLTLPFFIKRRKLDEG